MGVAHGTRRGLAGHDERLRRGARELTELIVIEPGYFSENSGAIVVCRRPSATVRLSEIPTCDEVFTAPTVLVVEPDITKPPERSALVETSAKVPLYSPADISTRAVSADRVLADEAS